jgi:nitroreductase
MNYIPQLVKAIDLRRSYRNYLPIDLHSEDYGQILSFIRDLKAPFDHQVDISLHLAPKDIPLVYFRGPRHFATFYASTSILEQAKLGFLGELVILFCESINLATCWIGHYNKDSVNKIVGYMDIKNSKILYCIVPIGYIGEKNSIIDSISKKFLSKKRKSVEKFLHTDSLREFPEKIHHALELACKAPSAMNSQKWYYLVRKSGDQISIELSKPLGYQHFKWQYYDIDVGTAAAHIWLGLLEESYHPMVKLENINNNAVWTFLVSI